jgi:hypothetical protein
MWDCSRIPCLIGFSLLPVFDWTWTKSSEDCVALYTCSFTNNYNQYQFSCIDRSLIVMIWLPSFDQASP